MFWRFGGYANISTIDTILDKPDFTLEDLLEESDLIQELKQHNAKLVEYLREQNVLEKLLEYVVAPELELVAISDEQEDEAKGKGLALPFSRPRASSRATDNSGSEEEGEKKRNRYAFVAAEVLSSDNWSIYEALMENKHLLRDFWQFLERPTPLDPLQASYFTKVNESLFDKKTEEMLELLKSLDQPVADMIRHVDSPMVMDLLLKIISLERTESGQGIVEWLYTQDVMPTLLSFLGPEHSWATQTSAGDFMKAIITVSANASQNEQTCIGPNELTRQLVSQPCVEQLIGYMLGGGNPLTVGVGIVIEVIRKNNSDYDPEVGAEQSSTPSSRDPIYLGTLLRLFAQHVPDFMSLIMDAPARKERLNSTFGSKIEPLGFDRFKTCELMAELLHCSNMGLLNEVGAEELITMRDTERRRLRAEGKLAFARGEDAPSSVEDLTMRIPHATQAEEGRRLEVTNVSTDEDGFEEVTHAPEEDTSHEFVRAEEDIPDLPALPNAPTHPPGVSFLDKDDDDFVDEPLSSPRLNVRDMEDKDGEERFEEPDLVVPPLSPTKSTPTTSAAVTAMEVEVEETANKFADLTSNGSEPATVEKNESHGQASNPHAPTLALPVHLAASIEHTEDKDTQHSEQDSADPRGLSPHPEDTPAPLFSGSTTEARSVGSEIVVPDQTITADPNNTEPVEESVVINNAPAQATLAAEEQVNPVVGDFLKMQFAQYKVVPTILSFFFKYPWNNFLHNVVYDIVQQVFNGPMDRGYNPTLAISLFEGADITSQVIEGQLASEQSQAQTKTRMGYMGHLTLIAEEVVKFTERHPPELLSETVLDRVMAPDWVNYVEGALAETRERDNAILGGVRPEVAMSNRAGAGAGASGLSAGGLSSIGLAGLGGGGNSQTASNVLAEAGLNGTLDLHEAGSNAVGQFAISTGTMMSGFGSSSDEDDDEDQEGDEDIQNEFRAYTDPFNSSQSPSLNPPSIPPPPPPPPPLNVPPSRARLQLAARLAMHKHKAEAAAANATVPSFSDASGDGSATNGAEGPRDDTTTGGSNGPLSFTVLKGLQAAPELTRERDVEPIAERDPRDPFADNEEDDQDGSGSGSGSGSDEEAERLGGGGGGSGGSGWHRGSWWRGVVRGARSGGGRKEHANLAEKFGDGRDDESDDSEGDAEFTAEDDGAMDEEEFGDFAMPEVDSAGRQQGAPAADVATGESGRTSAEGKADHNGPSAGSLPGIETIRDNVLVKPLPLHPVATKPIASPFSGLWPFSSQGFGIGGKEKEKETVDKSGGDSEPQITEEPLELETGEGLFSEDGTKIDRAVEAKRRTSIEEPDEEADIEACEEIIVGRRGRS